MIIMKFGGTSVGSTEAIQRVINIVKANLDQKPIVVVSAISEATNTLEKIASHAANKDLEQAQQVAATLQKRHIQIANKLISDKSLLASTLEKIDYYFTELNEIIKGIWLISELSNRSAARIYAYGELLSSTIIHAAMLQQGIKNVWIDARDLIITDENYLKGKPNIQRINQIIPSIIKQHTQKGNIVLTQGFIASNGKGVTTILGREGSDYSATLIGMAMDANEIQIWTDVDGIMTSDPKKIKTAKFIPEISFQEAEELSYFGAKVIHPLTIEPAASKNIPVRILNSMNPESIGTLIIPESKTNQFGIKSIAYKENINFVTITAKPFISSTDFLKQVFTLFHENQIEIDALTTSKSNIALAIDQKEKLTKITDKFNEFANISITTEKSLLTLVGKDLKNISGTIKKIFQILSDFNITMINLGSSNINLTFVVEKSDLLNIVQKLHDEFF